MADSHGYVTRCGAREPPPAPIAIKLRVSEVIAKTERSLCFEEMDTEIDHGVESAFSLPVPSDHGFCFRESVGWDVDGLGLVAFALYRSAGGRLAQFWFPFPFFSV